MEDKETAQHFSPGSHAADSRAHKADCVHLDYLLSPHFCVGCRDQHYTFHLPYATLQLWSKGKAACTVFVFGSCVSLQDIGYFYFTPVVAAILGEIMGHWLHDTIARVMTQRSKEKKLEPEFRLMAMVFSTPFMLAGLVLLGFALEDAYHYMIAALGW